MNVDPAKPAATREHGGKTYFFCSTRCAERFEKEPERFLAAPGSAGMQPAAGEAAAQPASDPTAAAKKIAVAMKPATGEKP
jgi:YHS domain-containing protein